MDTLEFRNGLAQAYHDEVLGNVIASALCERFGRSWERYGAMHMLARLEDRTGAAIEPVLRRHGIALAERSAIEVDARPMADRIESWDALMAFFRNTLPPYVTLYREMADSADPVDEPALDLLYRHEKALLDLAGAAVKDEPVLLARIEGIIAEANAMACAAA